MQLAARLRLTPRQPSPRPSPTGRGRNRLADRHSRESGNPPSPLLASGASRPLLRARLVLLLLGLLLLLAQPGSAMAGGPAPAQPLPAGRHFWQATGVVGQGFDVRDLHDTPAGPALFWMLFQEHGGAAVLGYPVSRAFLGRDGCVYQVFQWVVLQACPGQGTRFANTFELLTVAGLDPWLLAVHDIPVPRAGEALTFDDAVAERIAWLRDPVLRAVYFRAPAGHTGPWSVLDAINFYGLPTSHPRHRGPFVVQRFQRQTLQRWLVDHPTGLFPAETVVPVLGGVLLRETGLIGGQVVQPHAPGQSADESLPVAAGFPPVPGEPLPHPPIAVPTPEPAAQPTLPAVE